MQPQDQNQPIINDTPQDKSLAEAPISNLTNTVNTETDQIQNGTYQNTYSQPAQATPTYNPDVATPAESIQPAMEDKSFAPNPVIAENPEPIVAQPSTVIPEKKKTNTTIILIAVLALVVIAAVYVVFKYVLNLF
jgi:hypothetical protein